MTPDELAQELAAGRLRSAYLLAGGEPLLRDDALRALLHAVFGSAARDFDLERMDGASASPGALLDAARSLPVLAPRRVVVLREPEARRGAGAAALLEALVACVEDLRERSDALLVVVAERVDRRARWVRAFGEPAASVECEAPRGAREIAAFVAAEAKRQGVRLGSGTAAALAERSGPQLLLLRQELAKLSLLAGPGQEVTPEHVAAAACDLAEEPVWDLTDAIGEGRLGDALVVLQRLLAGGAPPPVLLASLAGHFRKLARLRTGGRVAGHPFALRKLERQAERQSPARLRRCLETIHDADEALKGRGTLSPELALERLVIGLTP